MVNKTQAINIQIYNTMKKYFKIASLFLFAGLIASCEDESKDILNPDGPQARVGFVDTTPNVPSFEDPALEFTYILEVGVTNRVNYDRAVTLQLNQELSTATPDQYTIDAPSTYIIPAGQFTTSIKIIGHYDALEQGVKETLVFDLVSVQGQTSVEPLQTRSTVSIFRACPVVRDEFLGDYTAVEAGETYTITATAGAADNELILSNVGNYSPSSETHVFLSGDLADPRLTYPARAYPLGLTNYLVDINPYGRAYFVGTTGSTYDSCLKTITIGYKVTVSLGSFDPSTIFLTKR